MNRLSQLATQRSAWLLLAFSGFALECAALYFQYFMDLAPCIMCIYQRTATLGIVAAGLVGAVAPEKPLWRFSGFAIWLVAGIWGWRLASEHIEMQNTTDPFAFSCEIVPNFPEFMPLHEWIPSFFAATGDCGAISWQFLGLSMPGWMQVIFAFYSVLALVVLTAHLLKGK